MIRCCWSFICFTAIFIPLSAYKILVFNPRIGKSHVQFIGTIADLLVEAGHNVTQLAPIVTPMADTNGSRLAKTITLPFNPKVSKMFDVESFVASSWKSKQYSIFDITSMLTMWADLLVANCEQQLKHKGLMDQLKAEKFDLAITEIFDPCPLGMIELFQIPAHLMVSASTIDEYTSATVGMPIVPSYVPSMFTSSTDEMTYFQRAVNLVYTIILKRLTEQITVREQALYRQLYGEQFVDLREKTVQAPYILTNCDPFLDFPKPTIHKLIEIGGLAVPKPNPLNKKWTAIMNQRKKVVLVSFGSVMLSYLMPNETKQAFLRAFDEFPDVTFIWKYEKDEHHIAEGHPNVMTEKWLPQTDLLAHPNLVAFLTHGGMNSFMETVNRGKPVIVVPLAADQMRNAAIAKRQGLGITLSVGELSEEGKLKDAFDRIINDKSYARKAERLSKMIAKRPNQAKEQLIRHVEFTAEFGHIPNFDPYGRKMSFISYFMLDIIIPFIVLTLVALAVVCYASFTLLRKFVLQGSSNRKEEEKKNL